MKTIKLKMKSSDTAYSLFQECQKLFPCWCWNEEVLKTIKNDREGDYEIEFKDVQEADEDMKNLSANDLKAEGIESITLPERLKLELVYFKKHKKHLDIDNITLCSGSRYHDGGVPSVLWHDVGMGVHWYYADRAFAYLHSRQPVKSLFSFLNSLNK